VYRPRSLTMFEAMDRVFGLKPLIPTV